MLRDDDVLSSLLMATQVGVRGAHLPGAGTDVHVGLETPEDDASMVAHHEAAHLGLNYMTAFGLLLRSMGAESLSPRASPGMDERLEAMVNLCRTTHEVFATTSGVWRSTTDFDSALAHYPAYRQYFDAGRSLVGSLREGSFAAHTAVECACWAAMQAPVGDLLRKHGVAKMTAELVPENLRPDVRLNILLASDLDPGMLDVALPPAWRDELMFDGNLDVPDLHVTFVVVASAYYNAFGELLAEAGMPTFAFDGHKSDPALRDWLEAHPPSIAEPIFYRPNTSGVDRFWTVTMSDAERVVLSDGRALVAEHFSDLPDVGDERTLGRDSFAVGGEQGSSVLVVVRPLQTLLKQYRIDADDTALLQAAATDGIVTAVRVEAEHSSGEIVTVLGILNSRAQLDALAAMPTDHGVLASIGDTCNWFSTWANYWTPALKSTAYAVRLADFPRRLWLDGLEREGNAPRCQPFTMGSDEKIPPGLGGLAVFFSAEENADDPPFLVVGTKRTTDAVAAALAAIFGPNTIGLHGFGAQQAKFRALVERLIPAEPWFDARSLEDLPNFAKMGERFRLAGRIAQRE
jgi:hypothetical protein